MRVGIDILTALGPDKRRASGARRATVIAVIFGIFLFLFLHTLQLGMSGGAKLNRNAIGDASPARADIIDRNGEILAKNIYTYDLYANPRQLTSPDNAALFIHSVLPDIPASYVLEKIRGGKYALLRRNISKDAARAIRAEKIDGLVVAESQIRKYPKHNVTSHIVGFVNRNGDGIGMEAIADSRLLHDASPLKLSIDSRIQSIMWDELSASILGYKARAAMGIMMNSRTGEILAAVSLPDFDPENIGDYSISSQRFRIMRDTYEMGSIFKIFNTSLALLHGIPATHSVNVIDPPVWGGRSIETSEANGFKASGHTMSVAQIMQHSCNVGSAKIALMLPENAQMDFFAELGLTAPMKTDFGWAARPQLPLTQTPTDRTRWAFGQGIAVTPMHVMLAANAIVNDGNYITPTIFRRDFSPEPRKVATNEVSRQIRQIMYMTKDTSAKLAAKEVHGIRIGGKTSTAQKIERGKYRREMTAFFVAFPIDAPKYSMLVIFDEPRSHPRTAAYNAVPAAGRILDAVIPLL